MLRIADSQPTLSLRCRDAEWLDRPEVVDAFDRPVTELARERRDLAMAELLLADQQARRWLGLACGDRPVLTCETARFGIAAAFERTQIDASDWTRWDELAGEVLFAGEATSSRGRPTTLSMQVRRSLTAIAAAVPMLTFSIAQASPPTTPMVTAAPPKLPEDGPAKPVDPAPTTTVAPVVTEAPGVAEPPPPVVMPPAPSRDDSLSLTGRNLWDGLEDKQLTLVMKDGGELAGTLVAHSGKDLAFARASDGTVVAVPKADIAGIRVRATAADRSPGHRVGGVTETGHRLAAGGGAMLGLGSAAALAGTVTLGIYVSALYISLPLLLPGLAMIGGGIGMLASANKKKAAYERAWGITSGRHRVMPTFAANRQGGQVGLVLRF
ncbi:hypothetical protein ACNOYE_19575 [Nannocystaceae bacterium ST9]